MKNPTIHCLTIFFLLFPLFFNAATIPFELIDGKIVIAVKIKNDQHHFIFDSGAFTIISADLQDKINAKKTNIIFEGTDANNAKSRMDVFSTNKLQISDMDLNDVKFSFADVNWMSSRACRKISGIFGANMMKGKIWKIDFKNRKMTVSDQIGELSSANSVQIPFSEEDFTGVPKINVKIRNQNLEYIFDTGSGMGFTLDQNSYNKIKDDQFLTFEGLLAQSISSVSTGERYVDLMEVQINNTEIGAQIVDSSPDARNLLGTRFMENYEVQLDFIHKKIILQSNGKKPEYSTFGVTLAPMKDDLVIINKLKIPQLSSLNLKDKIVKINHLDISKVNSETFCEVKKILDSSSSITIETAGKKSFTLEKKNVLEYLR
nr:aspartyl protease family protein [uncultured Chryseobacterium sp.]